MLPGAVATKRRIVLSGVNLTEMGPLAVFKDALASIVAEHSNEYEIVALVHRKSLFQTSNVTYLEFPDVKPSWLRRLWFEYRSLKKISSSLNPHLWLSMHDMTPNVTAERRAVYCHNPTPFYGFRFSETFFNWKFGLFTLFYRFLYGINMNANNLVIVQQDWIRKEFARLYGMENVVVAHPAVNHRSHHQVPATTRTRSGPYKFFYPAFPRTFKNPEVCLKAARILERRGFQNFEILLTFDQSVNRYAASVMNRFSDVKSARWLGLLPRPRVFELYEEADCLLFPSRLETWGMPITEFRAFGKPILAADLPYARETAAGHDQVAFFDPENAEALADLMQKAATGENIFRSAPELKIDPPFARNWHELWQILLAPQGGSAERKT